MDPERSIQPLRGGLRFEADPSRADLPTVLIDPDLGRRLRLDARAVEAAEALDRPQSLRSLAERLDARPEAIAKVVDFFERLHLLDTERTRAFIDDARRTAEAQEADPGRVPLLIRDDAGFSCTLCGSCCGGHLVGPVMADVFEGLRPHTAELERLTGTRKGLFFALPAPERGEAGEHVICHSRNGSCIFLDEERRCIIHGRLGAGAKPRVCRLFPYQFIATPRGVAVSIQMECRGFLEARGGRPLSEQEAEIRELLAIAPGLKRLRPVIALDEVRTLDYDAYEALEASLHRAVDAHPEDPVRGLLAMRDLLAAARGDDPPGEPERCGVEELSADLAGFLTGLGEDLAELQEGFAPRDPRMDLHTECLGLLRAAVGRLRPDLQRVLRPPDRSGQSGLFREKAHHHLMGKELTVARTLLLGFARFSLSWLLARALAVHRAREVKRRHVVDQDLMDALVVTTFLGRHQDVLSVLARYDEAVESLFYRRLPALVAHAAALPDPDTGLEIYKF